MNSMCMFKYSYHFFDVDPQNPPWYSPPFRAARYTSTLPLANGENDRQAKADTILYFVTTNAEITKQLFISRC